MAAAGPGSAGGGTAAGGGTINGKSLATKRNRLGGLPPPLYSPLGAASPSLTSNAPAFPPSASTASTPQPNSSALPSLSSLSHSTNSNGSMGGGNNHNVNGSGNGGLASSSSSSSSGSSSSMPTPNPAYPQSASSYGAAGTTNAHLYPALHLHPLNDTFIPKQISLYPPGPQNRVKIGRQTNAKTVPAPNNGYFDSKVLSRMHAEVWAESGKVFIKDVKSSNGTFINGERLSPEAVESDVFELHNNDLIEFGIDITAEDSKTIVHYKVAARCFLVMNAEDAIAASRNFANYYREIGDSPMHRRAGLGAGKAMAANNINLDQVLNRLQTELQKSRETGAELGSLTSTIGEIHDTLGGNLPGPPLPAYRVPPYIAPGSQAANAAQQQQQQQQQMNAQAAQQQAQTQQLLQALHTQLQDTQNALNGHVERIKNLEELLGEQERMKVELKEVKARMEEARVEWERLKESQEEARANGSAFDAGRSKYMTEVDLLNEDKEGDDEDEDADKDEEDDNVDDRTVDEGDIRGINAVQQKTFERNQDNHNESSGTVRLQGGLESLTHLLGSGKIDSGDVGATIRGANSAQNSTRDASTAALSAAQARLEAENAALTSRMESLSSELSAASELSTVLKNQYIEAAETIKGLESKVTTLEKALQGQRNAQGGQQMETGAAKSMTPDSPSREESEGAQSRQQRDQPSASSNEKEEIIKELETRFIDWKKSFEDSIEKEREGWQEERERLRITLQEWERKSAVILAANQRLQSSSSTAGHRKKQRRASNQTSSGSSSPSSSSSGEGSDSDDDDDEDGDGTTYRRAGSEEGGFVSPVTDDSGGSYKSSTRGRRDASDNGDDDAEEAEEARDTLAGMPKRPRSRRRRRAPGSSSAASSSRRSSGKEYTHDGHAASRSSGAAVKSASASAAAAAAPASASSSSSPSGLGPDSSISAAGLEDGGSQIRRRISWIPFSKSFTGENPVSLGSSRASTSTSTTTSSSSSSRSGTSKARDASVFEHPAMPFVSAAGVVVIGYLAYTAIINHQK